MKAKNIRYAALPPYTTPREEGKITVHGLFGSGLKKVIELDKYKWTKKPLSGVTENAAT